MSIQDKPKGRQGSKKMILKFLLHNIGRVIDSHELQRASGYAAEWGRRLREPRDEEGYQILSHKDRADLKPGQYFLAAEKRRPAFGRAISKEARAQVPERNGCTCQMCGLAAGDLDPSNPSRTIRLTMGHIIDKSKGGDDSPANLRALCTNCNEGLPNAALPKLDRIWPLSQVRRAPKRDQFHDETQRQQREKESSSHLQTRRQCCKSHWQFSFWTMPISEAPHSPWHPRSTLVPAAAAPATEVLAAHSRRSPRKQRSPKRIFLWRSNPALRPGGAAIIYTTYSPVAICIHHVMMPLWPQTAKTKP